MPQNSHEDPLTLRGFLKIFTVCLLFWGALALAGMLLYFPESIRP
jgi:hypothetical protein